MIFRRHFNDYNFLADTDSGITMRWGKTVDTDPICAGWPELADISISNYCTKNCDFCYRDSSSNGTFMSLEDYESVLDALTSTTYGSVFQVALGGGEPLEHPQFLDILKITKKKNIIANFTTNGIHLTEDVAASIKGLVGAVALSANSVSDIAVDKIKLLSDYGIKVNLHFVLDNISISDAIEILTGHHDEKLKYLNSVIFLTFKPRGRASKEKCLIAGERLNRFLQLVDEKETTVNIGFDACFVPLLMKHTDVNPNYIDACECGFFSIYIDEYKNVSPCSFSQGSEFKFNLNEFTMEQIWNEKFKPYRDSMNSNVCTDLSCKNRSLCRGTCLYFDDLSFCFTH